MKLGLRARIVLAFGLPLAVLGAVGAASWSATGATLTDLSEAVVSAHQLHMQDDVQQALADVDRMTRDFVYSGEPGLMKNYPTARNRLLGTIGALGRTMANEPEEARALAMIAPSVTAKVAFADSTIAARRGPHGDRAAYRLIRTGRGWLLTDRIRGGLATLRAREELDLLERSESLAHSVRLIRAAVSVMVALALAGSALALFGVVREVGVRNRARIALAASEARLREANAKLQLALANVKTLTGLLPICASCKKVRDDMGYWGSVERFIAEHTDAKFSHGVCPDCFPKLFPGIPMPEGAEEHV